MKEYNRIPLKRISDTISIADKKKVSKYHIGLVCYSNVRGILKISTILLCCSILFHSLSLRVFSENIKYSHRAPKTLSFQLGIIWDPLNA
jgi:hypothetical protein